MKNNEKGFTVSELLVAIILILVVVAGLLLLATLIKMAWVYLFLS